MNDKPGEATALPASERTDTPVSSNDEGTEKRVRKLTTKGFLMVFENLQRSRKSKLMQAGKAKQKIKDLLSARVTSHTISKVKKYLNEFTALCQEALETQNTLLEMPIPDSEYETQQSWLMDKNKEIEKFKGEVCQWVADAESEPVNEELEVRPEDSISNFSSTGSRHKSQLSAYSKSSSIASMCVKTKAERAALLKSAAVLQKVHDLDAEGEVLQIERARLRREKQRLEMEAKLEANTAKLHVLENDGVGGDDDEDDDERGNAMNAYLHAQLQSSNTVVSHPKPVMHHQDNAAPLVVRPKGSHTPHEPNNPLPPVQIPSRRPAAPSDSSGLRNGNPAPTQHRPPPPACRNPPIQTQASHAVSSGNHQLPHNHPPTVYDLMQRQNNITAQLVNNQALASLPPRVITEFDGHPLKYAAFIRAFEQAIEKKTSDQEECLYYLDQYTRGQPRELVRSCFNMAPGQGYARAKSLLKQYFGNEIKIAAAYVDRAVQWPMVKPDDVPAVFLCLPKGLLQCNGRPAVPGGDECAVQYAFDDAEVAVQDEGEMEGSCMRASGEAWHKGHVC